MTLQLHEVPTTHSDRTLMAVADASGRIFNNSFSPESHDLGVTFYLTAIGSLSQAQAVFTDDQTKINQVNLNTGQNPTPVTAGSSATYKYDVVFNRTSATGSNSCTVQMSVTTTGSETGLPPGASAVFSPAQLTRSGAGTLQTTLTISTTSAVPPGTYTFTVRATGTGGSGNDCATNDFRQQTGQTLVVAAPANTPPSVTANPQTFNEGTLATYTASWSDPDSGQSHTCTIDFGDGSGPQPGTISPSQPSTSGTCSASHTYADGPNSYTITVTVSDGAAQGTARATATVNNVPPTITSLSLSASSINENGTVTLSGTFSDPGNLDSHAVVINWGDGSLPTSIPLAAGSLKAFTATHVYLDDNPTGTPSDTYTISVTVTDKDEGTGAATAPITVNNVPPVLDKFTASSMVVAINTPVTFTTEYSDAGTLDTHKCIFNFDDGTSPQDVPGTTSNGSGSCTTTRQFAFAGVYSVKVNVEDDDKGESEAQVVMIAVYDPSAGFVTGGGWINSPAGAYLQNPGLTGRANFGFVSKYKKGANTPEGQTEFQFKAGDLNFHSSSYEWLVVAGAKAQFKGSGTINGIGPYKFLLTAYDADVNNNDSILTDKFRIKIWDEASGTTIYDNKYGTSDDIDSADPQDISGGSIVIHSK